MKLKIFYLCFALTVFYAPHTSCAQTNGLPQELVDLRNNLGQEYNTLLIPITEQYEKGLTELRSTLATKGNNECVSSIDKSIESIKQNTGVTLAFEKTDCRELRLIKIDFDRNSTNLLIATLNIYVDKLAAFKTKFLSAGDTKKALIVANEIQSVKSHIGALSEKHYN